MTGTLAKIIETSVSEVIEEYPKLFAANSAERARKLIVRRIMKSLIGPKESDEVEKPAEAQSSAPVAESVRHDDPRAVAYTNLRSVAGAVRPLRIGENIIMGPEAREEAVQAFGDLPVHGCWLFVTDRRQLQAWREFFDETLPGIPRREITELRDGQLGAVLPWPWPPSKTGKIYDPSLDGAAA